MAVLGRPPRPPDERYEEKVDRSGGPDACHPWTCSKTYNGYGRIKIAGRFIRAHRYGWEKRFGPIPDGMFVCHTCDRPDCQNPTHWFLGSPKDNMIDKRDKGRCRNQHT